MVFYFNQAAKDLRKQVLGILEVRIPKSAFFMPEIRTSSTINGVHHGNIYRKKTKRRSDFRSEIR